MKLKFSQQILEKNSPIEFHESPSSKGIARGETDGQTRRS